MANVPTNKKLYSRVKSEAKRKFKVYPSAYANAWLVKTYKKRGGGYRTTWVELVVDLLNGLIKIGLILVQKKKDGSFAKCGRSKLEKDRKSKYPKCVPLAKARRMSKSQIRSAVTRKRKAQKNSSGKKPTNVKTFA